MTTNSKLFKFIGGAAGCGKSYKVRQAALKNPQIRLTASTGIAAINLGDSIVTCSTINSLLRYYNTKDLEDAWTQERLDTAVRDAWNQGIREIVIDEVSMLSGRQLDIICQAIDYHNEYDEKRQQDPLRLTLVADFCQLPPVDEEKEGFAFEAKRWDRFEENTEILTEIRRQADPAFVSSLREVRKGNGKDAVDLFKPQMVKAIDVDFPGTTIVSRNIEVDRFNELRQNRLDTPWVKISSIRTGEQLPEWDKKNIPITFEAKIDALVMLLVNKSVPGSGGGAFEYVNGDLAYLRDANEEEGEAIIELLRTGEVHTIYRCLRENKKTDKKGNVYIAGTCEYMPLRVSYASSVHKSQGLTMDNVQINLNNWFFKYPGMAYVALSRARSLEGIRLVVGNERTFINRCNVNPKVERWI